MEKDSFNKINLANTVDYDDTAKVRRIFQNVQSTVGELPLAAHFHDTPKLGLTHEMAALDVGIRRFDPALVGLGGYPFAAEAHQARLPPRTQCIYLNG